ncbi:MAG: sigma-70 family RNA polymerase sigma factor [Deltaproteobacteria bacterium]|nr:MAG: sigma-70 family RNA polymerase sigma factor [Deltaproteobacteria bacterium]
MARAFREGPEGGEGAGPPDRTLALRAREGDRRAFEALVRRYQRPVYGLVLRLLGTEEEALDAAQEAFVKAWKHLGRYDETRPFGPWLLSIARNEARDRLRRRRVRGGTDQEDPSEELARLPERRPGADVLLDRAERQAALEAALMALPPKYREVVILHHLQGYSVARIAEIVERPPGTVMTWLYRGRAALKEELEEKGVAP